MTASPQRIAVLGATGHIGQAVVRHALDHGRQVTALSRRWDPPELHGLPVRLQRIDACLESLADAVSGHDLLIDAAAPYPLELCQPGTPAWRADVDAAIVHAERVIDAARRCRRGLAFVSTCATLPRCESPPTAAAALWRRSVSPYFEAKAAMEQMVLAAAQGLPVVVVNPAVFLGPWEYRAEELSIVRTVLAGRLPVVMDHTICVIDVRDVAEAIDCALARELFGKPIPLAGHNIALAELVFQTACLAGVQAAPPITIDGGLLSAAAFWMHAGFSAWGMQPPNYLSFIPLIPDVVPMFPSAEQNALGVSIRPLTETLRDAIEFHRALRPA
ncbi:MAG TPA: NAD-dependent epimerase/dehydratase family protein [Bryobacteraceae bacterium]|jgi:dihydroflavonol-4-reductase|nr:NAD-dependent epimerase/dehydratase family protein [Bryobacteraceae bacterium]